MTFLGTNTAGTSELSRIRAVHLVMSLLAAIETGTIVGGLGRTFTSDMTLFLTTSTNHQYHSAKDRRVESKRGGNILVAGIITTRSIAVSYSITNVRTTVTVATFSTGRRTGTEARILGSRGRGPG
jgi:hypothetical protein